MSRPVDWSPLELGSDPVPGEPDVVESAGKHYQRVADAIETAAARLREIAEAAAMTSLAVSAMRDKAEEVADDVHRAHQRYRGVGDALVTYSSPLRAAQEQADAALRDAVDAREQIERARRQLAAAEASYDSAVRAAADAPPDAPPADHSQLRGAVRSADADLAAATSALERAMERARDAVADRDRAAATAVGAIKEVEDTGDLNDSWWDDTGAKLVAEIAKWAGAVAAIAGIAALLVGWIPIIGQALAAVLGTIALIAAAVSLLANLSLALTGHGSWGNVLLDAISLATFGIGRAVIMGARASYRGAQATARLNAGRIAATSNASRGAAGLPVGNAPSTIRSLVGGRTVAGMSRDQARSMLQGSRAVPSLNWRTPFTTAWADLRGFGSHLRTLSPGNLARALDEAPAAFTQLRNSSSFTEGMARLTQNSDVLTHLDFTRAAHVAVQHGDEFARATRLTHVQVGSVTTATTLDGYQLGNVLVGSGPSAAQELSLGREPTFEVGLDR